MEVRTVKEGLRIQGGLYGALVGDALGVPVEFSSRESRRSDPVIGMRAYGTWNQPAGTWSDDGALLLCTVESLSMKSFDPQDMAERFLHWYDDGHWAAHGEVFDVGNATSAALGRLRLGVSALQAGGRRESDNGNGSLMRILPVSLASIHLDDQSLALRHEQASAVTHGHARSLMACSFHGFVVRALCAGKEKRAAVDEARMHFTRRYAASQEFHHFRVVTESDIGRIPEEQIQSGGYVIDTLVAALWCLLTTDTYEACVLRAVNLGGDTDTTACVAGGLAGVLHGLECVPAEWMKALPRQVELKQLVEHFSLLATP